MGAVSAASFYKEVYMLIMLAMAAASMIASKQQNDAQMKAKVADAKLQRQQLKLARIRASDDYQTNMSRAKQAAQGRELSIAENRVDAEARVDATFAGSGISGQSIDEIDSQIESKAANNRVQNRNSLDNQLSDATRHYSQVMNDSAANTQNIDTTYQGVNTASSIAGATGAAASVQGLDKKVSDKLGIW